MNRRAIGICAAVVASGVVWLLAQQAATNEPISRLFPAGPLLYLEARDFAGMLADWNAAPEKKLWLASDNYQVFSRSRLFLKLSDAHAEFADTAGFLADLPMVQSVAGRQAALAVYDIGALEFLYVTRIDASAAVKTVLFQRRSSYETRNAAGTAYYVRRGGGGRTAAFASANGLLFLATREDLVANALKLMAKQPEPAMSSESWFAAAVQPQGEFRMVLNMRRLLDSVYFRSYWIQRNASELKPYTAGVVDLFREAGQLREERMLIREAPETPRAEAAVAHVLAWSPDDVGLRRAWAEPSTSEVAELVRRKIVSPGVTLSREQRHAPLSASPDAVIGSTADLETRIDQQPLEAAKKNDAVEAFTRNAERVGVAAVLHVQRSKAAADGVYVDNESAVALLGKSDWPEVQLPEAQVHRAGRALVIASTPAMLKDIVVRLGNAPSGLGAQYIARYAHARELEPFTRMMSFIDTSRPQYEPTAPQFFSGNVASVGRVLARLQSVDVTVRASPTELRQQVVYRTR